MSVTEPAAPLAQPTRRGPSRLLVIVLVVAVVALAATVAVLLLASSTSKPKAAAPSVPVVENIPQPNPACTPAADRKITLKDDISRIYWFGWLDGKQTDMPVGQAMMLRIRGGHELRDAWYCPPRADW